MTADRATKIGAPLRDAAADPREGDTGTAWPVGHDADGRPAPMSPVPVTVSEARRVTEVAGTPPAEHPVVSGDRLKDAAAEDPADRPSIPPESSYPARIPRVPAELVQTSTGPAWHFDWNGTRSARGYQQLPALIHHRGRTVLLVEADGAGE